MDLASITVSDFKARFVKDFNYGTPGDPDYVSDQAITNAFEEAQMVFNQALLGNDISIKVAYLFLTAHLVCLNIRAAADGANSTGAFPVASRSVGSVSESYNIPRQYLESPWLATYTQTSYGIKYLSMVLPSTVGNMAAVHGGTNP